MIEDARKIPAQSILEADLCIVGGGAAAIAVAMGYKESGRSVILLPGGGQNQTALGLDLYRGKVDPQGSHEPLEENRLRMWGGTTTVWGGRCVPFDPIDFEPRSWLPGSGWPIGVSDVQPYLEPACILAEAGHASFDSRNVFPNTQAEIIDGFDNRDLVSWPLERWSVPTDFCKRYRKDLDEAPNVRVLLHAHAIHLQLAEDGHTIAYVDAACSPGQAFRVKARRTVIACGALENARLLLAARDVSPSGIGNDNDLVGRYYQSHRFGVCGQAVLKDPDKGFIYEFEKDGEGVYCRRRFWLTPGAQEQQRVCNVVGFFFRTVSAGAEHRNAMVSTVLVIKTLLGGARKGPRRLIQIIRAQRRELLQHAGIILKDGPSVFGQLAAVAYTRCFQKRRLPTVLPPRKVNRFPLFYQTEHAPNRESRVVLDPNSVDEFGMPRLEVQIRFSEIDHCTCSTFIHLFKQRLEEANLGTFEISEQEQQLLNRPEPGNFNSNSHNIGTTRMSDKPDQGVVDTNCRVHSVGNLYIAGSSVFPTSSHANPTLMIIALALRLAAHLKQLD
ncbi:MAG: GMC family oxidoreductase [Armatimonadetes bacterium]|nr:GMC family oxidoreductase [Akkermansiaceae bacterium]